MREKEIACAIGWLLFKGSPLVFEAHTSLRGIWWERGEFQPFLLLWFAWRSFSVKQVRRVAAHLFTPWWIFVIENNTGQSFKSDWWFQGPQLLSVWLGTPWRDLIFREWVLNTFWKSSTYKVSQVGHLNSLVTSEELGLRLYSKY